MAAKTKAEKEAAAATGAGGHPLIAATEQGFIGRVVDTTPNEHYTIAGQLGLTDNPDGPRQPLQEPPEMTHDNPPQE